MNDISVNLLRACVSEWGQYDFIPQTGPWGAIMERTLKLFLSISSFTHIFNILEPCYKGSSSLLADILIIDHIGFQSIFHITLVIEGVP